MGYDPLDKSTWKYPANHPDSFYPHHQGGGPMHKEIEKPHGYGHPAHKRAGKLRLSGQKGADRLGKR